MAQGELAQDVAISGSLAQYDEYAKNLLSYKKILAHILISTVECFRQEKLEDVARLIEDDVLVSKVPVNPGHSNMPAELGQKIAGMNTEDLELNAGEIKYDILFYVRMPDGLAKIIINVECQKDEPGSYGILNRAIFYVCRLVSAQKNREFAKQDYDNIKKVYSIWVCLNMPVNSMSHIHLSKDELLQDYSWQGDLDILNIVMLGITNELPRHDEKYRLHRLLSSLLSDSMEISEKLQILQNEFKIGTEDTDDMKMREEVRDMCNLSVGIYEKGISQGLSQGLSQGRAEGTTTEKIRMISRLFTMRLSKEDIAKANDFTVPQLEEFIKKHNIAVQ